MPRILLLLALLLVSGCRAFYAKGVGMHEVSSAPIDRSPATATVVFVRPSFMGFGLAPMIVDERGRFVGQLSAESYFVARIPAGHHRFVTFVAEQGVLDADLEAGRVYVVKLEIIFRVNMSGLGRPYFRPIRASDSEWIARIASLPAMQRYEPDAKIGATLVEGMRDEITKRLREADETMRTFAADDRRDHTLFSRDGQ
jgi:hypothetical protein